MGVSGKRWRQSTTATNVASICGNVMVRALYLAERVDKIVVAYADELFRKIKSEPYDKSIEQRIQHQDAEHNRQKQAAEKRIKAAQYKQQRYEDEVLKCLDGTSAFSQEMLARLIAQAGSRGQTSQR